MKRWIETFLIIVITWSIRIFIFLGFFAFLCPNNFTLNTRIFSTPEIFEPAWIDYCCFSILFRIEINDDRSFGIWHTVMAHNLWLLIYNRVTHRTTPVINHRSYLRHHFEISIFYMRNFPDSNQSCSQTKYYR